MATIEQQGSHLSLASNLKPHLLEAAGSDVGMALAVIAADPIGASVEMAQQQLIDGKTQQVERAHEDAGVLVHIGTKKHRCN